MRVMVTGGAGYIGSHVAKALASSGHEPITFDRLSTGHRSAVRWGPFIEGDLAHSELLQDVFRKYEIEAVLHFAASAYVGESMTDPGGYFQNNVANTLNLLDAMMAVGVSQIVFSSSCATYGVPESLPVTESTPQRPINPYGESKLIAERVIRWYGEIHGLNWMALRYFNAAGADLDGELGEEHDPETHLIPLVIHAALGQRPHVDIFGTDYPTPDGTNIRDYVHVVDLADAHVRALHHVNEEKRNLALNLSAGRGYSVREVITKVEGVSELVVPVREGRRRPGDPAVLIGDARRAGEILGWKPRYSGLDNVIETAWAWETSHRGKGSRA